MLNLILLAGLASTNSVHAYIWPSPQLDALETMRFEQPLFGFLQPCNLFIEGGSTGRSNAADWLRTAYHDMATHNATDGTGGLDASIRFSEELARPEVPPLSVTDPGDGFANTLGVVAAQATRYISIADMIALGAVMAIENCDGPEIAFRGGRVDALEPNAPGVPEPQDALAAHIASFARQGFTQTEMIGLVACGHTFGGVQHSTFPDIVPQLNETGNSQSVAHFDTTSTTFDNNITSEYISGTTQNPLVVGLNDTTNSDKRIFGSDGNATMQSFADSPELFSSTCAQLFARMMDTVPSGVQLTDVITPLPVKPEITGLVLDGETLQLSGRFWNMTVDSSRTVHLLWDDHVGGQNNITLPANGQISNSGGRNTAALYQFSPPADFDTSLSLNATTGVTTIRFVVDGTLEDQGGVGFALQDSVVLSATSCMNSTASGVVTGRLDIAIRNNVSPTRVYIGSESFDNTTRPVVTEIDVPRPSQSVPVANAVYSMWSLDVNTTENFAYTISADIDGEETLNSPRMQSFSLPACSN
ncbi:heme peroxidase [Mycena polygramma]|nr:heme peroxidase [Mycena polygramma]